MIRFFTWTFTLLFTLTLAGGIGALTVLYYFGSGLPDYAQLANYNPPVVSRLYASDGRLFAEYATQKRVFVPIEAVPRRIIQTFLAAEDKNFYEHPGLDFFGIIRAAVVNLSQMGTKKRPMGASTITQQVAKNLLLASIANQASYERKIKEAILAFRIENALSKDRILELYVNDIYLGAGSYGIAAAALNYFNKSLDELTIAEAAFLAGLPKAPSKYNPKHQYEAAKARRDWVITRMYEERIITREEAIAAKAEPIVLKRPDPTHVVKADYFAEELRRHLIAKYGESSLYRGGLTVRTTLDPRIQKMADSALRKGIIAYDRRHGWRGPYQHIDLKTSMDGWQSQLESIITPPGIGRWELAVVLNVDEKAAKIGLKSGEEGTIPFSEMTWARQSLSIVKPEDINTTVQPAFVGPSLSHPQDALSIGDVVLVERLKGKEDAYSLQQIPAVSGALVVMDAHTGRVLAMTGGFSFEASQFNRATQALRQPGSAIKPFVYLAAMERGFSPATVVSDAPISIAMGRGLGTYSPKNVKTTNYGSVPLRVGLQKSLNRMTIRLVHEYIGMKSVAKMIEKFGVMDRVPMQIAMAIGAGESTLLRMITAYASLANGGKKLEPTLIDRIQDRHGKTIFASDTRLCSGCQSHTWLNQETPVIEDRREQLADPRSIYQITSMLEGAVRAGSAKKAQSLGKILAIKTGTTNEERDAWTFAFTPEGIVVGTYIGFDNPQPMGHLEGGSRVALPIIIDFMGMTLEGVPSKPFKMPPGMKLVRMREMTGGSAQLGDTGVIYEALKENQSLHGRSSYDSETSYGRFSDSYDPETSYERSSNSYDPETSYERSSNSYDPGTSYGRSSNSYEGSLPGTYEEVGTYSSPSLAPVDSSLTGTGGLY